MDRKAFLTRSCKVVVGASIAGLEHQHFADLSPGVDVNSLSMMFFLAGDVMTGRGIDQILSHSVDGRLYEPYVKDAETYVAQAEQVHGPIPEVVDYDYIWGDAIDELERTSPDLRLVNLETAVTTSDDYWKGKQVHYRMHPQNTPCLTAAGIDCCVLSNNHALDWGYAGLEETLRALETAGIKTAGAGRNIDEAQRPAVFTMPSQRRVLVFGAGSETSGIPRYWAATEDRPGVYLIDESSRDAASDLRQVIERYTRPGDLIVVSIHWGSNWGYEIPSGQKNLAHSLIDDANVDIVHGHSSHHVKGIEIYRNRPILYGCGDLLTDYEGIAGFERYRGDLGLMYFISMDASTEQLIKLEMRPTQMNRLQVKRASSEAAKWLAEVLNREGGRWGTHVEMTGGGMLTLYSN